MPTIDEVQPRCRFVGEDGGVRGAPALPPDFAKCGGCRRVVEAPSRRRLSMRSQWARRPLSRCDAETAPLHVVARESMGTGPARLLFVLSALLGWRHYTKVPKPQRRNKPQKHPLILRRSACSRIATGEPVRSCGRGCGGTGVTISPVVISRSGREWRLSAVECGRDAEYAPERKAERDVRAESAGGGYFAYRPVRA